MITAVLDTNVLASGFIGETKPDSTSGELIRRWRARRFTVVISDPILAELAVTFGTSYFTNRLSTEAIEGALASLRTGAVISPITVQVTGIASHPEDDAIIATALSAQADYLVTGDKPLLARGAFHGTVIVSPRQFLEVLRLRASS